MGDWDDGLDEAGDEAEGVRDRRDAPGDPRALEELDLLADEDDAMPDEARAELEAVAAAEAEAHDTLEAALAEAQRALQAQRAATLAALGRYREALLAAEPELPPDLVAGDTLAEVDASVATARQTVARIRERMAAAAAGAPGAPARGFPVGSPSRSARAGGGLSSSEKIAAGLSERRS